MTSSSEKGKPLPKFGEWDVNNPASADGFTVIFAKARDEKKGKNSGGSTGGSVQSNKEPPRSRSRSSTQSTQSYDPNKKKWLCCF
ncbi:protein NOI4-like [Salvia miltiorrhiza]|uniref:protein NOI4-like n=1 Tax=Salvia miltiorrhiza TaxID=226208 RepID=UPI0025AC504C|nr:protein NOI4-like [Salvia miltiorrhiza]